MLLYIFFKIDKNGTFGLTTVSILLIYVFKNIYNPRFPALTAQKRHHTVSSQRCGSHRCIDPLEEQNAQTLGASPLESLRFNGLNAQNGQGGGRIFFLPEVV